MLDDLFIWLFFVACVAVSFLLSGMEAGVFTLNRLRIRQQRRAGRRNARVLLEYLENPENFLWTILVGNTVANLVVLGWPVVLLHRYLAAHPIWVIVIYAVLVVCFFIFCDLLPKTIFRLYPNRLCTLAVVPFRGLHRLLAPLVAVVESVSGVLLRWRGGHTFTGRLFGNRQELRLLMQESAQALSSEEVAWVNRVLDFQTATVRQVMKPLDQAATVTVEFSVADALSVCKKSAHTRLPVWAERDGRPRVIGVLSCERLLFEAPQESADTVAAHVRPAVFLDEHAPLEVALRRLQRSGHRLAIVLGADRTEMGIVSLQDILGTIFGEVSL